MTLQQIHSGNYLPNFIRINGFFIEDITKDILVFFPDTLYSRGVQLQVSIESRQH